VSPSCVAGTKSSFSAIVSVSSSSVLLMGVVISGGGRDRGLFGVEVEGWSFTVKLPKEHSLFQQDSHVFLRDFGLNQKQLQEPSPSLHRPQASSGCISQNSSFCPASPYWSTTVPILGVWPSDLPLSDLSSAIIYLYEQFRFHQEAVRYPERILARL
jgi:hypothetical protein